MAVINPPRPASNGSIIAADSILRSPNGASPAYYDSIKPRNDTDDTEAGAQETGDLQQATSLKDAVKKGIEGLQVDEQSARHLKKLNQFQEELEDAADQIIARRKQYTSVVAVITYWEGAKNLKHMEDGAKELLQLLGNQGKYGFEAHEYVIRRNCLNRTFTREVTDYVDTIGQDKNSLFILYYGGHARTEGDECLWMAENDDLSPKINWSTAQKTLFEETLCDKVFLFDCCHAGDMIRRSLRWEGACELLGAAGGAATANARPSNSFTKALLKELDSPGIDVKQLWTTLTDSTKRTTYNLTVDPYYFDFSGGQHPFITLRPLQPQVEATQDVNPFPALNRLTDARVLIKVTFDGAAQIFMKQWRIFLSQSPKDVFKMEFFTCLESSLKLIGLFESNSCTAIIQLPVWLWAAMSPTIQNCEFLAVIRSDNYANEDLTSTQIMRWHSTNSLEFSMRPLNELRSPHRTTQEHFDQYEPHKQVSSPLNPLSSSSLQSQSITTSPKTKASPMAPTIQSAPAPIVKGFDPSRPAATATPSLTRSPVTHSPTLPKSLTSKTGSGSDKSKTSKEKKSEKKEVRIADKIERSGLSLNKLRDELDIGFAPPRAHSLARLPESMMKEKRRGSGFYGDIFGREAPFRITLYDQD